MEVRVPHGGCTELSGRRGRGSTGEPEVGQHLRLARHGRRRAAPVETCGLEVPEQLVHGTRPGARRAAHGVPDAHRNGDVAARERDSTWGRRPTRPRAVIRASRLTHTSSVTIAANGASSGFEAPEDATTSTPRKRTTPKASERCGTDPQVPRGGRSPTTTTTNTNVAASTTNDTAGPARRVPHWPAKDATEAATVATDEATSATPRPRTGPGTHERRIDRRAACSRRPSHGPPRAS